MVLVQFNGISRDRLTITSKPAVKSSLTAKPHDFPLVQRSGYGDAEVPCDCFEMFYGLEREIMGVLLYRFNFSLLIGFSCLRMSYCLLIR